MLRKIILLQIFLVSMLIADIELVSSTKRHAYFRGENATIEFSAVVPNNLQSVTASCDVDGLLVNISLCNVYNGLVSFIYKIDTSLLKEGQYNVKAVLSDDSGRQLGNGQFPLSVTQHWNPGRLPVWLWAHQKFGLNVDELNDNAANQLKWYCENAGINTFNPGGGCQDASSDYNNLTDGRFALYDYALRNDWAIISNAKEAFTLDVDESLTYRNLRTYLGTDRFADPFNPAVRKIQDDHNARIGKICRLFPQIEYCTVGTEIEDFLVVVPSVENIFQELLKDASNDGFILPGVISDNDKAYLERLYYYQFADGLVRSQTNASEVIKQYSPDIVTFTDPFRAAAVYGRFDGLDAVSTWTYTTVDPKMSLYVETLIAEAKPLKKKVMPTITLLNYPGTIFPQEKGWPVTRPDIYSEAAWLVISRKPDAIGVYFSSECDPVNITDIAVTRNKMWDEVEKKEPYQLHSATYRSMKKFADDVLRPLGPTIKSLNRPQRQVAVLSSESSRVYCESPVLLGYYGNEQIYSFYSLLAMCGIEADVIFDETIQKFGLDDYDVLVMPKCDTLLKSVYDNITAFQKRGGLVISDQYLRAPLKDVIKFDFDLTYRMKISVDALAKGKQLVGWDDHIDVKNAQFREVKGVTAQDDRQIMESYAEILKKTLAGKVECSFASSSLNALVSHLEYGSCRYLFVINDKREYGSETAEYKAVCEKAVAQTTEITVNGWGQKEMFLYDLVEHKQLPAIGEDKFTVELPGAGGRLIAVSPIAIGKPSVEMPAKIEQGASAVIAVKMNSLPENIFADSRLFPYPVPVKVQITAPDGSISSYSDYYCVTLGIMQLEFKAAINDLPGNWTVTVDELFSGKHAKKTFKLTECRRNEG